jgi:activator of 2-hydroxyglutaryl-CoA dehydratase
LIFKDKNYGINLSILSTLTVLQQAALRYQFQQKEKNMNKTTKLIFPLLFSALLAAGCAQAVAAKPAETQTAETQAPKSQTTDIQLKKTNKFTKLVLVTNGNAQTFDWFAADLADPASMEKALAEVPEAERENIKKLLSQMKEGNGLQLVTEGDHKVMVHHLGSDADGVKVLTNKKVIMHKIGGGDGSEFSLLKSLLTNAKLSKEQLQELQKLLDSKY